MNLSKPETLRNGRTLLPLGLLCRGNPTAETEGNMIPFSSTALRVQAVVLNRIHLLSVFCCHKLYLLSSDGSPAIMLLCISPTPTCVRQVSCGMEKRNA